MTREGKKRGRRGQPVLAVSRLALRDGWKTVCHWIRRDAALTPHARDIYAALNAAIRRRKAN